MTKNLFPYYPRYQDCSNSFRIHKKILNEIHDHVDKKVKEYIKFTYPPNSDEILIRTMQSKLKKEILEKLND